MGLLRWELVIPVISVFNKVAAQLSGELIVSKYVAESITMIAGCFGHEGLCQLRTKCFVRSWQSDQFRCMCICNIISVLHNVKHPLYIVPYIYYVYIVETWWRGIWQPWHHELLVATEGSAQHGISPSHYMCCYLQRGAKEDGQAGVGASWLDWSKQEVDIQL